VSRNNSITVVGIIGGIKRYDSGNLFQFTVVVNPDRYINNKADLLEEMCLGAILTITKLEKFLEIDTREGEK